MKKYVLLMIILLFLSGSIYGWRSYSISLPGSDVNGVATATVGEAEGAMTIRVNPAGLVQTGEMLFSYDFSSSLIIRDLFIGDWKIAFDTFPFLGWVGHVGNFPLGISLETLFEHNYINQPLQVRALRVSTALAILPNFSIGLAVGPLVGLEGGGWAVGWNVRAGLLWKPVQQVQLGLSFNTPFQLNWNQPISGATLSEDYPLLLEGGLVWQIRRRLRLYASLEYVGVSGIRYILDEVDRSPMLNAQWENSLHPKIGVRFVDPLFGSLLSFGMMTASEYYGSGGQTQYLLTAGIRANASWTVITASLVDSYLLKWVATENTGEEKIHIGISFAIPDKK